MKDWMGIINLIYFLIDGLSLVTFILLKIFSVILWSWFWVLSPLWITIIIFIIILAIIGIQFLGIKINF